MFLEASARALAILQGNFATDLAALATAKSVAGIDATIHFYDEQPAAVFATRDLPGLGVYGVGASTNSRRQDQRDSVVTVSVEYYCRGTDATVIGKQTKLAVEAILRSIDRMAGGGGVVLAGDPDNSVQAEVFGLAVAPGQTSYEDGCRVRFPVMVEDTGLS